MEQNVDFRTKAQKWIVCHATLSESLQEVNYPRLREYWTQTEDDRQGLALCEHHVDIFLN